MLDHALTLTLLVTLYVPTPPPELQPGPDTTVITEPLKADGTPDYAAWLNRKFGEGVTPENNFAVDLLASMPSDRVPDDYDLPAVWRAMGLPPAGPEMMKLSLDAPEALYDKLLDGQWRAEDHPDAAAWLAMKKGLLDALGDATKKPHSYVPLVIAEGEPMLTVLLPQLGHSRRLARTWHARAMMHLGAGNPDAAWADAMAAYRMARHVRRGVLIDHLVGISIEALAHGTTEEVLAAAEIDAARARRMLRDLEGLPPVRPVAETFVYHERFSSLDAVYFAMTQPERFNAWDGARIAAAGQMPGFGIVDLNFVLRRFNRHFDAFEASCRLVSPSERREAFDAIVQQLEADQRGLQRWMTDPMTYVVLTQAPQPIARRLVSETVADLLTDILLPALSAATRTETKVNQITAITPALVAMAGYRAERGEYPGTLDALVPAWLDAVPIDVYTGEPVRYKIEEGRPVVYSVGPDGEDDGGRVTQLSEDDTGLQIGGYEKPDEGGGFGR
ncbi:MAG: hypothetical protein AAF800_05320 [Planctomycetota bacterium]